MKKSLPSRTMREHPNLDRLKRQAKELLEAFTAGEQRGRGGKGRRALGEASRVGGEDGTRRCAGGAAGVWAEQ